MKQYAESDTGWVINMKIWKKKGIGKYILSSIVVMIVTMLLVSVVSYYQYRDYEKKTRLVIVNLIGTMEQQMPQLPEEEWIALLNTTQMNEQGNQLLEQYGITEDMSVIAAMENEKIRGIVLIGVSTGASGILLLLLFFCYIRKRDQRISELTTYMKQVAKREYHLALTENTEDELSHLQNELYKITVMLKESSEHERRQREAVTESVSDISHQLKTPMTSIQILLDNLLEDKDMEEPVRLRFLEEIARQMEGMRWLIGALLKLSRLDADVVDFKHEKICVGDMIEEIRQKLEVLAEVREVQLMMDGNVQAVIMGDYQWNCEALMNIMKNAIEHSRPQGVVTIAVEENDVYTKITVADEGEGIAGEDLKHIFDRFYRASNASKDSVGIGLAMAKSIIEKQEGYISVESKEGEGTVFTIKYMKIVF